MSLGCSAFVVVALLGAAAGPVQPLRVCSDPNNLPFSNRQEQGFENKIAELVARDLNRPLKYVWMPQRRGFIRQTLEGGQCDVIMGIPAQVGAIQATRPYYRSSYAFVARRDRHMHISSFDDARLKALTIGIQITGDDYNNPPAAQALASRHLIQNVRGYTVYGDYFRPDPQRELIDAVADGRVDLAIAWGPLAGYFGGRARVPLDVVPLAADNDGPALPFVFDIAMGVRRQDTELRASLDVIIMRRSLDIRHILTRYGVPLR